jgi:hypothetical protein
MEYGIGEEKARATKSYLIGVILPKTGMFFMGKYIKGQKKNHGSESWVRKGRIKVS